MLFPPPTVYMFPILHCFIVFWHTMPFFVPLIALPIPWKSTVFPMAGHVKFWNGTSVPHSPLHFIGTTGNKGLAEVWKCGKHAATQNDFWPITACLFRDLNSIQRSFIGMRKQTFTLPKQVPLGKRESRLWLAYRTSISVYASTFLCLWQQQQPVRMKQLRGTGSDAHLSRKGSWDTGNLWITMSSIAS